MVLGYEFVDLTAEQKLERRAYLDLYAFYQQVSVVVLIAIVAAFRWITLWLDKANDSADDSSGYDSPSSAEYKYEQSRKSHVLTKVKQWLWRLGDPVREGWGTYGEWIGGTFWSLWMLFLCMNQTGNDYLHLTKRFGIVPASLLPFHYLVALKSPQSPIQLLLRTSHEQLNVVHQVLGRIIHIFFLLHAVFYLSFFISIQKLSTRITDTDVLLGLISIFCFDILGTSALARLRRRNYRIFYLLHVIIATAILPLLYFHVHHIRLFVLQTLAVWALLIFARWWHSSTHFGSITTLPGTSLILLRLRAADAGGNTRNWKPGQHVYLHSPSPVSSGPISAVKRALRTNPFTIASIPSVDKSIILVARVHKGNTAALAALAPALAGQSIEEDPESAMPLRLEGPYGMSTHLSSLSSASSILLIAGGVGATFALPLWRSLQAAPRDRDVRLVWAVRRTAEAAWAGLWLATSSSRASRAEVYVSGSSAPEMRSVGREPDGSFEMEEREGLMKEEGQKSLTGAAVRYEKVDVSRTIDEVMEDTRGKVAVVVCGPETMVKEARSAVGRWVERERDVIWHAEQFGL